MYKRESLISYLNYEDGKLNIEEYTNAVAYLLLTDARFLESTTKRVRDSENTALRTYEESHSFVKYIIDNYGKESFFRLSRREESYQAIFGKSCLDMLNEWLDSFKISKDNTTLNIKKFKNILN